MKRQKFVYTARIKGEITHSILEQNANFIHRRTKQQEYLRIQEG